MQTDSPAAWMDRANWPEEMKQRAAEFKMEEAQFIKQAALAARKKYFSASAWAGLTELVKQTEDPSEQWRARVELFRDIEAASGGANGRRPFAARWRRFIG